MKPILALAAVLAVIPSPCFALWRIAEVSKEQAKEMGIEVRSTAAGPTHVQVELEFKTDGKLKEFAEGGFKEFSRVELRFGQGDNPPVTAPLREDRSRPGRVVVAFSADRSVVDNISLWIKIQGALGGTIYDVRVKDFVELRKAADERRTKRGAGDSHRSSDPNQSVGWRRGATKPSACLVY